MELNHLKYFYVVAQQGSFTRAAKVLRVQQPNISKMVKHLEAELGVVLIERGKKGIRLTSPGTSVFESCKRIFDQVDEIRTLSEREKTECRGPMSFGVTDAVASHLIPPVLRAFLQENPRVMPSLFSGNSTLICREILEGRIDFGCFFATPEPRGFEVTELVDVPFQLVIATAALRHRKTEDVFRSLIISREIDYGGKSPPPMIEMLRKNKVAFRALISTNTYASQQRLVEAELGASLLPTFMVRNEIRSGLFTVLCPRKSFVYSLKLIKPKGKVLPRNASTFLEHFMRALPRLVVAA